MKIECASCGAQIQYNDKPPRFCQDCGASLSTDRSSALPGPPANNIDSATVPPTGMYSSSNLTPATLIGGYQIIRELGSGGMGRVYEAKQKESGRAVALKILSCPIAKQDGASVDRFVREGRLAAQISHPRSTFVYEAGYEDGQPYIVMELMPGKTLQDELRESGKLPVPRAVDVVLDIIDGLLAAHHCGVIHRDVKPSNCFVGSDGRMKIGDFGLSKSLMVDTSLTRTGTFMGTPSFSSPEQIRGGEVDQRTDIYSLGATMYNILAGRPPFMGDPMSVTAQIISDPVESLRKFNKDVPKGLELIVLQALEKNPADRFQDLETMRSVLLPYASKGTSLVQIGRRAAAFMIDYSGIQILMQSLVGISAFWLVMRSGPFDELNAKAELIQFWGGLSNWIVATAFFAICEGWWGCTPGKHLMGMRVVNLTGETPGIWRSMLRAFAIPGGLALPLISIFVTDGPAVTTMDSMLRDWLYGNLTLALPALLCFFTMRESNGFRGLHDFVSGTRVLQLPDQKKRFTKLPVQMPFEQLPRPFMVGKYSIVAKLPESPGGECIYLGVDEVLDRKVLIFQSIRDDREPSNHSQPNRATHVNRATRTRWLQGSNNELGRWDAFEYFGGIPFSYVISRLRTIEWTDIKYAIFDLARELDAAVRDNSLPSDLSFDNFLIQADGRGRLIDSPVHITESAAPVRHQSASDKSGDIARASNLLREVLEWCLKKLTLPTSAITLINEFREQPVSAETLDWLRDELDAENRRISRMTWDSRLGVMAATVGVEFSLFSSVTAFFGWLVLSRIGYFPVWKIGVVWTFVMICCYVIGRLTQGGPAFRFLGVEIRNKNGQEAPRWKCGLRTVISWSSVAFHTIVFGLFMDVGFSEMNEKSQHTQSASAVNQETQPDVSSGTSGTTGISMQQIEEHPIAFLMLMVTASFLIAINIFAAVFSVFSPQRGIQDYLLGTRLIPK